MGVKVVVIGAGMAGIMAAQTLHDAGLDVVLLEARNRIGGRTHTDHSLGAPIDLGAAWVHGIDGNPLTPIAQQLGVDWGHTDFLNRSGTVVQAYDEDGRPLDQAEYAAGLQLGLGAFALAAGSQLYDLPQSVQTFRDLLDAGMPKPDNLSPAAEQGFYYQTVIHTEYVSAADAEQISARLSGSYVSLTGGDYLLHGGGFNALTDHLVAGLDVRLETAVSHITLSDNNIILQTSVGELTADYAVLAVPLGVLKQGSIDFDPPLPAEKTAVIERIGFGSYEKIALRFDKFYWPRAQQRFNYLSTGDPSLFHAWLNVGYYTGEPIIISYHAHRRARRINEMSDAELVAQVVEKMTLMFGDEFGPVPEPVAYARTNWEGDPFSRGSYSFDSVGQLPNDRNVLAAGVNGRIFFAGEATHPHFYATVHGAYETGIRAAREIIGISSK
ncbi:MAG: FAD-dependent oxidoreductase [Chloroflexota bacterium]